ncbi:MAG: outer membrane lipoprotein chaperone LolA [Burkholderiaceae bacterium]|nr:MAG: outer membrane lipoprotein chaperone LolA [Burkholderiaceae bacterium]
MRKLFTILLIAGCAQLAWAGGMEDLESFVKTVKSGQADFTQVVTSPPRPGQAARSKTSSGTFEFLRPNRFRFLYEKPFKQSIVADGQTLWLYDADLNQVTARKQSQVLGSTPAALIAAAPDLQALRADFNLTDAPDQDGLQWAVAMPKAKDGPLQSVRVGFRLSDKGSELAVLEILDSFGQRSVLTFSQLQVNLPLAAGTFKFEPPTGADVVRQ